MNSYKDVLNNERGESMLEIMIVVGMLMVIGMTVFVFWGTGSSQEMTEEEKMMYLAEREDDRIELIQEVRALKDEVEKGLNPGFYVSDMQEINEELYEFDGSELEDIALKNVESLSKNPNNEVLKTSVMKNLDDIDSYLLSAVQVTFDE
ncbi:hypothetical protein JMA_38640 (plasmid) [Jeotgalibacillus malaysiensis]|uniref:Uncharacterized protein n=1 Tax=Jeotgalibacillus malaysiensis TaxID=1508404 RepID=A0A0B5AWW4_9BACL|nr:hypothetical protein [Jeotgalibacillus malaysiensis]AJD93182.1 hypothetical protein JMA_38640 [Jeotgalibacillus malaysiensis]